MTDDEPRKVVMLRLPPEDYRWLRRHSVDIDVPMQGILTRLIARYRAEQEREGQS